jgi:hypothetical protein
MRSLVQPSPSMRCAFCDGELLFKRLEPDNPAFDTEVQIFVCSKCGRPHSRKVVHDPYTPHVARETARHGDPPVGL